MILHLLRHAEAEDARAGMTDEERELTPRGLSEAEKMAQKIAKKLDGTSCILVSPLPRARDTGKIFAQILGKTSILSEKNWLATGADPQRILKELRAYNKEPELLLVGHEPWISELTSLIISGHTQSLIKIKKLGLVTLHMQAFSGQGGVLLKLR